MIEPSMIGRAREWGCLIALAVACVLIYLLIVWLVLITEPQCLALIVPDLLVLGTSANAGVAMMCFIAVDYR